MASPHDSHSEKGSSVSLRGRRAGACASGRLDGRERQDKCRVGAEADGGRPQCTAPHAISMQPNPALGWHGTARPQRSAQPQHSAQPQRACNHSARSAPEHEEAGGVTGVAQRDGRPAQRAQQGARTSGLCCRAVGGRHLARHRPLPAFHMAAKQRKKERKRTPGGVD